MRSVSSTIVLGVILNWGCGGATQPAADSSEKPNEPTIAATSSTESAPELKRSTKGPKVYAYQLDGGHCFKVMEIADRKPAGGTLNIEKFNSHATFNDPSPQGRQKLRGWLEYINLDSRTFVYAPLFEEQAKAGPKNERKQVGWKAVCLANEKIVITSKHFSVVDIHDEPDDRKLYRVDFKIAAAGVKRLAKLNAGIVFMANRNELVGLAPASELVNKQSGTLWFTKKPDGIRDAVIPEEKSP